MAIKLMVLFLTNLWTVLSATSEITDVYLTVSSLSEGGDRRLVLNWRGEDADTIIALYDTTPHLQTPPLIQIRGNHEGYYRTRFRFPEQRFTKENLTDECLGFWIAAVKSKMILLSSCMRGRPHWMFESRDSIVNLSLVDLMLPGSHNAGCYAPYDLLDDNVFSRYLYTQEESIFNQLAFGIRYLDLRVAFYNSRTSPENFWITHSSFRTNVSVRDVVRQVKQFLEATRGEIVIMDFHRFVTGFKGRRAGERHRDLISLLESEVGDIMIPVSYSSRASLAELWYSNKRLYVGYADKRYRTQSSFLFPAVKHLWGDADDISDLWTYLNDTVCDHAGGRISSAMCQLTPTTTGVLFNTYGGLRKMADTVNRRITEWFGRDWNECANIVATDFVLGNHIVELAIRTNLNRSSRNF